MKNSCWIGHLGKNPAGKKFWHLRLCLQGPSAEIARILAEYYTCIDKVLALVDKNAYIAELGQTVQTTRFETRNVSADDPDTAFVFDPEDGRWKCFIRSGGSPFSQGRVKPIEQMLEDG